MEFTIPDLEPEESIIIVDYDDDDYCDVREGIALKVRANREVNPLDRFIDQVFAKIKEEF